MSGACFSLGPLRGLSFGDYKTKKAAWNVFKDVYNYNAQVSTIIGTNPSASISYYRFADSLEIHQYRQGQSLHSLAYPTSNWDSIGTG